MLRYHRKWKSCRLTHGTANECNNYEWNTRYRLWIKGIESGSACQQVKYGSEFLKCKNCESLDIWSLQSKIWNLTDRSTILPKFPWSGTNFKDCIWYSIIVIIVTLGQPPILKKIAQNVNTGVKFNPLPSLPLSTVDIFLAASMTVWNS